MIEGRRNTRRHRCPLACARTVGPGDTLGDLNGSMSAIAGVFRRRDRLRPAGEIDADARRDGDPGPGRHATPGLADERSFGHGALHGTPESVHESMPLVDPATGDVIVADVRLDNREELIDALGVPATGPQPIGDGRLLLAAYHRWGEDCRRPPAR